MGPAAAAAPPPPSAPPPPPAAFATVSSVSRDRSRAFRVLCDMSILRGGSTARAPPNKTLAGLLLLQGMHSPACTGIRPAAGRASSAASFRRLDGALVWWAPAAPMHPQPGRPAGCKRTGWEGGGETSTRPRVITVRDRISRLRGGRRADAGTLCDGTQKREARFLHDALPCSGASDLSRARTDLQVRHGEVESGRPHPLHRGRAGRRRRAPLGRGGEGRPRASLPWPTYLLWRPGGVV